MVKRLFVLATTALVLTGCYHTAAPQTQTNTPATTQPAAGTESTGGDAMAENKVEIKNFAFSPKEITVKPGTKLTVTNMDISGHSFTSDDGSSFDAGIISQGKSVVVTAPTKPGSYPFHCTPHPNMQGTLVVKPQTGG